MDYSYIFMWIGLMAGSIFFIDGWGPSEKDVGFLESKRFRGLSILIAGSVVSPLLDYFSKNQKPVYFIFYLKGCILGWFFVFLSFLLIYLFWKLTKDKDKKSGWYKSGEFAYSLLDFIYLGISDNPHLTAKRTIDLKIYELRNNKELSMLDEELKNKNTAPFEIDASTKKKLEEYELQLRNIKTESEYTFEDWYYKGLAEFDKKELEKCIAYMKNAIEKDAKNASAADAYLYIGLCYNSLGLFQKAIDASNTIVAEYQSCPYLYLAHHNKGNYHITLNQFQEALTAFEEAIKLNPNYINSINDKGYVLIKLDRLDEALTLFEQVAKSNSTISNPFFNLASIFSLRKDKENMLINLKRAVELEPQNKATAKKYEYFKNYWEDEDFIKLVA